MRIGRDTLPSRSTVKYTSPAIRTIGKRCFAKDLEMEKEHLALYERQLSVAEGNTALRLMLEQILVEETAHVDELEMYLGPKQLSPTGGKK